MGEAHVSAEVMMAPLLSLFHLLLLQAEILVVAQVEKEFTLLLQQHVWRGADRNRNGRWFNAPLHGGQAAVNRVD